MKPGITGLAQVKGRNSISWGKKIKYDLWYVNDLSFKLDLLILFMTIKKTLKAKFNADSNNTMIPLMYIWKQNIIQVR